MNTENEGTAAATPPAAPSAPPAPVAAPAPENTAPGPTPGPQPAPAEATAPLPPVPGTPGPPTGTPYAQDAPPPHPQQGQPGEHPTQAPPAQHPQDASWPPPPPVQPGYGAGGGGWHDPWAVPTPPAPRPKGRGGFVAAVLAAALLAGGVGGGIGYVAAKNVDDSTGSTTVSATAPRDLKREAGSVADLAAKALPSVVTINAEGGNGEGGTGTGFVYDQQGHILTNNHVVASAANGGKLSATFSDGRRFDAEVIGRAEGYDVAVLKLKNASGLTPLPLGDSDKVAVGDSTIAIGAPFGLSNTVTTGIVSAKKRPVASGDGSGNGKNSYMSALQTDASINPGNSGGPLIDSSGAVIGINSAIQSAGSGGFGASQAGSIGLGFAIPINQAKNVAEQLIKDGRPVYPKIGAFVDLANKGEGAKISGSDGVGGSAPIEPSGPAAKAGLRPGDVITKLDNTVIDSGPTLISEIWTHKPGDQVKITYLRDGKQATVDLVLGSRVGDDG